MRKLRLPSLSLLIFLLSACVTINVYFPAAAAERAADQIIDKVWGPEDKPPEEETSTDKLPPEAETPPPVSWLNMLIVPVQANRADLDISSPTIRALEQRMHERHKKLDPHYDSGAVGLTNDALITLRDASKISLRLRNQVSQWVTEENQDRLDLYREIAKANGHPEWEDEIRETFAKRWIERAKPGWWYQDEHGQWRQK